MTRGQVWRTQDMLLVLVLVMLGLNSVTIIRAQTPDSSSSLNFVWKDVQVYGQGNFSNSVAGVVDLPEDFVVNPDGSILVANAQYRQLTLFTSNGSADRISLNDSTIFDSACFSLAKIGEMYLFGGSRNLYQAVDPHNITQIQTNPSSFSTISGLAYSNKTGLVYVSDLANNKVLFFHASNWTLVGSYGTYHYSFNTSTSTLYQPRKIALDCNTEEEGIWGMVHNFYLLT